MSDPVVIELSPGARALLGRLQAVPATVGGALAHELDHQNDRTIGYAQKNKLSASGPGTLGVRNGRLRRSLSRNDATVSGSRISGSIGSNVVYAAVHEYGFDGEVQVEGFTRRNPRRDVFGVKKKKLSAAGVSYVRPFSRHMRMPARSFIHSSLQERAPAIGKALSRAVVATLEGAT